MSIFEPAAAPLSVTILVLPGSSMMTVASTLDPLRALQPRSGTPGASPGGW